MLGHLHRPFEETAMGKRKITVIGGGIAGLVASIAAAEGGAAVTLHEAHGLLGGRARSTTMHS